MDYDINKSIIVVPELIYKGSDEIPIDFDFTLPDFCPDVGKILKCHITPFVVTHSISGDKLNVEGNIRLELLYLELNNSILRCYKTETPFAYIINLKKSSNCAAALIIPNVEYINCRAVSPRRIDVHGAFTLRSKVYSKQNIELSKEILNEGVEQLKRDIKISSLSALLEQVVSINEVLDIGADKPFVEAIIKTDTILNVNSYNCFSGKISIKGDIRVKILYISDLETGKLEVIDYEIPVNQEIDAPEVNDDTKCTLRYKIINHEEKINNDSNIENISNLININLKLLFTAFCFEEKNEKILSDAYSISHELEPVIDNANLIKFENTINDQFSYKTSVNISDNKILKIIDVWSNGINIVLKEENDSLVYNCKIQISLIAFNIDSVPFHFEKTIEFTKETSSISEDINKKDFKNIITSTVNSIGYKISGEQKLDLKLDITVSNDIFRKTFENFVSDAKFDENKPKTKDPNTALTIYYAKKGENVWNIAKKYSTTINKIKDENEIEDDDLYEDKAILVPMC